MAFNLGSIFGGGGNESSAPYLPTLSEVMKQYSDAYGQAFSMTEQYAPREAQLQLDLLRNYGGQIAQAQYDLSSDIYPYTTGLQEQLAQRASENIGKGAPEWMQQQYLNNMRGVLGEQSIGGFGADTQSVGLMNLGFEMDKYFDQLGQDVGNRMPIYTPQIPQYTNIAAGFTPGQALQYELGGFQSMPTQQSATGAGFGSFLGGTDWGGMLRSLMNTGSKTGGFTYPQPIGGSNNTDWGSVAFATQGLNY